MLEERAAGSVSEAIASVTGGSKPVHRFLRAQPKSIGVVLVMMGISLFLFAIPMYSQTLVMWATDVFTPFWLGILFFVCGLMYILSERNPSKKMITVSLALSIISVIGVILAVVQLSSVLHVSDQDWDMMHWFSKFGNHTEDEEFTAEQYYMPMEYMDAVFFCHGLIGGVLIVIMAFFSGAALRSSRTQAVVVMRSLPSAD